MGLIKRNLDFVGWSAIKVSTRIPPLLPKRVRTVKTLVRTVRIVLRRGKWCVSNAIRVSTEKKNICSLLPTCGSGEYVQLTPDPNESEGNFVDSCKPCTGCDACHKVDIYEVFSPYVCDNCIGGFTKTEAKICISTAFLNKPTCTES